MKKIMTTILVALMCMVPLKSASVEAAPDFKNIPITVSNDLRDFDRDVALSCEYTWGQNPVEDAKGNVGEVEYAKFTLNEDSMVHIKAVTDDKVWWTTEWLYLYPNSAMTVAIDEAVSSRVSQFEVGDYLILKAGTYYMECGWKRDGNDYSICNNTLKVLIGAVPLKNAVEIKQTQDTKKNTVTITVTEKFADQCAYARLKKGKVSDVPWHSCESSDVEDGVASFTVDATTTEWYTLQICGKGYMAGSKTEPYRTYIKVDKIKKPGTKGKTYTKSNVQYKITKNNKDATGTVTVMGMKSHKTSVTIPNTVKINDYKYTVTKINKKAFYKKNKLKKVTIKATKLTSIGQNAFKGINKKAVVYVPKAQYKAYNKKLKTAGVKAPMKIKKK